MHKAIGFLLAAVLGLIALLHFYWAAGGSLGRVAAVPTAAGKRIFEPSRLSTVIVGLAFCLALAAVLGRLGYWGTILPPWVFRVGVAGVGIIFLARAIGDLQWIGFFKRMTGTPFAQWDTWLYSPLCVLVAAAAFLLAWKE